MSETANIAALAERISGEIFSKFGWAQPGTTNIDFPCVKQAEHKKTSSPTHPTDVVFSYDDPYEGERIFLLTDLKSYAKESIGGKKIVSALRDLAKSVDCANVSDVWREKFANDSSHFQISGLLFIYNHDGEYDADFQKHLSEVKSEALDIPKDRRIYVIGPKRIEYLLNVVNDLEREQGKQNLPLGQLSFLYPDRQTAYPTKRIVNSARVESLLGPWLMVPYSDVGKDKKKHGMYFYYDGTGERWEEFMFIFDFCFKNQLVSDGYEISVRLINAHDNAPKQFETALQVYKSGMHELAVHRLSAFSFFSIQRFIQKVSFDHVGMERRLQ